MQNKTAPSLTSLKLKYQNHVSECKVEFIAQGTALNYFALAHVFDAQCGGRETLIVYNVASSRRPVSQGAWKKLSTVT